MSDPYDGQSTTLNVPGVSGTNTAGGDGVSGTGRRGVVGESDEFQGVYGHSTENAGVVGESAHFHAVFGVSHTVNNAGVYGANDAGGFGVIGTCDSNIGVAGDSKTGIGVRGTSQTGEGVHGISHGKVAGVVGESQGGGTGVYGSSHDGRGVEGWSTKNYGVTGDNVDNQPPPGALAGVRGTSINGRGVEGWSTNNAGIFGIGKPAGYFQGDVTVTGDVILSGADCAEEFDVVVTEETEPGTVMVLDELGALRPSQQAYDKKVAGVISGAGSYRSGIILDKKGPSEGRVPVALVGKAYCKVDAQYASIEVGDLLTTSDTPGHAMKADDPFKAFGSVIGKALRPLEAGQALIPILIALQ